MGAHSNISHDRFPRQSNDLGKEVLVCFNYDTKHTIAGFIVRDDVESPFVTLIKLIDDRYVSATECQYTFYTFPPAETHKP